MPRAGLASDGPPMLKRLPIAVDGGLIVESLALGQNANEHALPSHGRTAFALLPDGSLSL